jgi:hypothetical protein
VPEPASATSTHVCELNVHETAGVHRLNTSTANKLFAGAEEKNVVVVVVCVGGGEEVQTEMKAS